VRHAKAGHRDPSVVDDRPRPLTPGGWRQAKALVERLVDAGAAGPLLSSSYLRCIQTLEPLGEHLGQSVVIDDRLAEGNSFTPMLDLMHDPPDGSVLCSHGDMIPDVMAALERRRCEITTEPNWKKGSVWLLTRDRRGRFVSAAAWPPPD